MLAKLIYPEDLQSGYAYLRRLRTFLLRLSSDEQRAVFNMLAKKQPEALKSMRGLAKRDRKKN